MSDNNNDKPFSCNAKGCQMKFTNIDHLSQHQKRHGFSLSLPTTPSKEVFGIVDQTPTPSRFLGNLLQNWEEVGLPTEIQEISGLTPILNDHNNVTNNKTTNNTSNANTKSSSISDNPFAASFQSALQNNNNNNNNIINTLRPITDSPLNTPSIFPNEGLMAIVNAALNTPDHDFRYTESPEVDKSNNNEKNLNSINTNNIGIDNSLSSQSSNSSCIDATTASVSMTESSDTSCGKSVSQEFSHKPQKFQAVSVICSANTNFMNSSVSQTIPNIVISQTNNQIKSNTKLRTVANIAQTSKNAAIIAPKTKESSITIGNANSLYKVILRLPDGRSVQLLQQPIVSSAAQTITAITNSSKINNFNISNNQSIINANKITIGSTSSSSQDIQTSGTSFSSLQSRVDATLMSLPPKAKPGRKSKFAPEEDPKEKKARSLERNRAAAMRCRLKRKHWIDSLEEKADEYEKINEKLQSEVVVLRKEVTLLKTALLAHKDCPVTLQQQKATNASSENTTTITTITTNSNYQSNGFETNGMT